MTEIRGSNLDNLATFLDALALGINKVPRGEARAQNRCLSCDKIFTKEEISAWSPEGQSEFGISGFCEPCFDGLFSGEEEDEDE